MENGEKNTEKKESGVKKFFRAVFVHNIGLKILSIALGAVLVLLAVAL